MALNLLGSLYFRCDLCTDKIYNLPFNEQTMIYKKKRSNFSFDAEFDDLPFSIRHIEK